MRTIAITRDVSPSIARCELTHLDRAAIDYAIAVRQHDEYVQVLERLGCAVLRIGTDAGMPDSVFIEDAAVVFDELAIVTRPGAESRRREVQAVAEAIGAYRRVASIEPPGTLDGGDVLVAARQVFVGVSSRSNTAGVEQVRRLLSPIGYRVQPVVVRKCLHLKSAVTALNDRTLLINRTWAAAGDFEGFDLVDVDPAESTGANVVRVGEQLLYSAGFPRTLDRLVRRGFDVAVVDVGELAKAEGAVTCCSLIFEERLCHSVD